MDVNLALDTLTRWSATFIHMSSCLVTQQVSNTKQLNYRYQVEPPNVIAQSIEIDRDLAQLYDYRFIIFGRK